MTQYKVTVKLDPSIKAVERRRAGIVVSRVHGYEGELTSEQLEAIKADACLTVTEVKAGSNQGTTEQAAQASAPDVKPEAPKATAKK